MTSLFGEHRLCFLDGEGSKNETQKLTDAVNKNTQLKEFADLREKAAQYDGLVDKCQKLVRKLEEANSEKAKNVQEKLDNADNALKTALRAEDERLAEVIRGHVDTHAPVLKEAAEVDQYALPPDAGTVYVQSQEDGVLRAIPQEVGSVKDGILTIDRSVSGKIYYERKDERTMVELSPSLKIQTPSSTPPAPEKKKEDAKEPKKADTPPQKVAPPEPERVELGQLSVETDALAQSVTSSKIDDLQTPEDIARLLRKIENATNAIAREKQRIAANSSLRALQNSLQARKESLDTLQRDIDELFPRLEDQKIKVFQKVLEGLERKYQLATAVGPQTAQDPDTILTALDAGINTLTEYLGTMSTYAQQVPNALADDWNALASRMESARSAYTKKRAEVVNKRIALNTDEAMATLEKAVQEIEKKQPPTVENVAALLTAQDGPYRNAQKALDAEKNISSSTARNPLLQAHEQALVNLPKRLSVVINAAWNGFSEINVAKIGAEGLQMEISAAESFLSKVQSLPGGLDLLGDATAKANVIKKLKNALTYIKAKEATDLQMLLLTPLVDQNGVAPATISSSLFLAEAILANERALQPPEELARASKLAEYDQIIQLAKQLQLQLQSEASLARAESIKAEPGTQRDAANEIDNTVKTVMRELEKCAKSASQNRKLAERWKKWFEGINTRVTNLETRVRELRADQYNFDRNQARDVTEESMNKQTLSARSVQTIEELNVYLVGPNKTAKEAIAAEKALLQADSGNEANERRKTLQRYEDILNNAHSKLRSQITDTLVSQALAQNLENLSTTEEILEYVSGTLDKAANTVLQEKNQIGNDKENSRLRELDAHADRLKSRQQECKKKLNTEAKRKELKALGDATAEALTKINNEVTAAVQKLSDLPSYIENLQAALRALQAESDLLQGAINSAEPLEESFKNELSNRKHDASAKIEHITRLLKQARQLQNSVDPGRPREQLVEGYSKLRALFAVKNIGLNSLVVIVNPLENLEFSLILERLAAIREAEIRKNGSAVYFKHPNKPALLRGTVEGNDINYKNGLVISFNELPKDSSNKTAIWLASEIENAKTDRIPEIEPQDYAAEAWRHVFDFIEKNVSEKNDLLKNQKIQPLTEDDLKALIGDGKLEQKNVDNCTLLAIFQGLSEYIFYLARISIGKKGDDYVVKLPLGIPLQSDEGVLITVKKDDLTKARTATVKQLHSDGTQKPVEASIEPVGGPKIWKILEAAYLLKKYKRDTTAGSQGNSEVKREEGVLIPDSEIKEIINAPQILSDNVSFMFSAFTNHFMAVYLEECGIKEETKMIAEMERIATQFKSYKPEEIFPQRLISFHNELLAKNKTISPKLRTANEYIQKMANSYASGIGIPLGEYPKGSLDVTSERLGEDNKIKAVEIIKFDMRNVLEEVFDKFTPQSQILLVGLSAQKALYTVSIKDKSGNSVELQSRHSYTVMSTDHAAKTITIMDPRPALFPNGRDSQGNVIYRYNQRVITISYNQFFQHFSSFTLMHIDPRAMFSTK